MSFHVAKNCSVRRFNRGGLCQVQNWEWYRRGSLLPCSRIYNNDCRTFRPRRPLSTAYRTKETAVWDRLYSKHWPMVLCDEEWVRKWPIILRDCEWVRKWPIILHDCVCVCDWLKWVTNDKVWRHALFTKQTKAMLEVWWQYTKTKRQMRLRVGYKGCGLRMGFQTMGKRRPLSSEPQQPKCGVTEDEGGVWCVEA